MKIRFWGVRGSIPTPLSSDKVRNKIKHILNKASKEDISTDDKIEKFLNKLNPIDSGTIGGDTSCIEIRAGDKLLILDMGSGLVRLGNKIINDDELNGGKEIHIFVSHTHWDHIMGFPMFKPAFYPQSSIKFYGVHDELESRLVDQQNNRFFPVALDHMASKKEFIQLEADSEIDIDGIKVSNTLQHHPGRSYAFRINHEGKSIVYATDSQYKNLSNEFTEKHIEFFKDADLLIFDAMYSFEEAIHREDYGHSSAIIGIDLAVKAGIKNLALFHHEPDNDDDTILMMLKRSLNYKKINYPNSELEVFLAYEGLELNY